MDNFKRGLCTVNDGISGFQKMAKALTGDIRKYTFLFFSNECPVADYTPYIQEFFPNNVVALTTAGEICMQGYQEQSISGLSLLGDEFLIEEFFFKNIAQIEKEIEAFTKVVHKVNHNSIEMGGDAQTFAILLIDGLSGSEESVTGIIGNAIGSIPLIGGSTGDGLKFGKTFLYNHEDRNFSSHCAKVLFVTTTIPFQILKTQHFAETDKKLVITESQPATRTVIEIDGAPAAEAYAELLGLSVEDFSPQVYSENPLMLKIGTEFYVRSIQKVNPDKSLTFYCAIDDGLVLTLAKRLDIVEQTKLALQALEESLGEVGCSLFFECILRRLEVVNGPADAKNSINQLYDKYKAIGFHTYGEQFGSIHINQTLTGVLFGKRK